MGNNRHLSLKSALLLLLTALGSASAYCRQGSEWIEFNGNCYHWSNAAAENWFRSQLNCHRFGGNLVSVANPNENNFLQRLTQCRVHFWLGMVNTVHALKAQVRGYEWWDGTQHNYTSLTPRNENYYDCVVSDNLGKWFNIPCQGGFSYVCKAPAAAHGSSEDQRQLPKHQEPGQESQDPDDAEAAWFTGYHTGLTDAHTRFTDAPTELTDADTGFTDAPTGRLTDADTGFTDAPTRLTDAPTARPTTSGWRPTPTRPPIGPGRGCQSGWQQLDNACYFVSDNKTNYFNAQMSCQAMGASVTSILTVREHTLLTVATGCHSQMWIGLEKARPCFKQPSKDHCWVWMDRSPVNYFEWAPGQAVDRRDAECVILDGQWKVVNCYLEYRYICKKYAHVLQSSDSS